MDSMFIKHIFDLSRRSVDGYTFTPFLGLDEQSEIQKNVKELEKFVSFGGCEGCERTVFRFGNKEDLGYEVDFPIVCINAKPVLKKFADELSHRDFLGALMNLGIERSNIGDIVVKNNEAYIFVLKKMAAYVRENLTKVKHTVIKCEITDKLPDGKLFETESEKIIVASRRIDCIIAEMFNLSRTKCNELFSAQKVFVNGRLNENNSYTAKDGDIISVRGFGRFILSGETGTTKKGRTCLEILRYV